MATIGRRGEPKREGGPAPRLTTRSGEGADPQPRWPGWSGGRGSPRGPKGRDPMHRRARCGGHTVSPGGRRSGPGEGFLAADLY